MRHSTRIACFVALLAIAATVEAAPILPAEIAVGASVAGSFSFPVVSNPTDQDPSPLGGRYVLSDSTARMVVEVGGFVFPSDLDGLIVQVANNSFDFDAITLIAAGDKATFPFLTDLPHQGPNFDPVGFFGLTFWFRANYLFTDAFPTSIDPLAARSNPGGFTPTGIYQRVEGVAIQSSNAFPEWLFQFDIDPLTMELVYMDGVLNGTYSGTVAFLNPGEFTPGAPIPEPSSMVLVISGGLLMLRKMAARSDRTRLVRK